MEKLHISQAIVVEGKYDKIRLESLVDGFIITTEGFGIFKNKEKVSLLRALAKKCGLLILTDSDSAGFIIRSHLKGIINEGEIFNAYIPDILGKESRKSSPSKEGKLGVEGMDTAILIDALKKSGVIKDENSHEKNRFISTLDLYEAGLFGSENSNLKRKKFQKELGLPERLNKNSLLELLNRLYSYKDFKNALIKIQSE